MACRSSICGVCTSSPAPTRCAVGSDPRWRSQKARWSSYTTYPRHCRRRCRGWNAQHDLWGEGPPTLRQGMDGLGEAAAPAGEDSSPAARAAPTTTASAAASAAGSAPAGPTDDRRKRPRAPAPVSPSPLVEHATLIRRACSAAARARASSERRTSKARGTLVYAAARRTAAWRAAAAADAGRLLGASMLARRGRPSRKSNRAMAAANDSSHRSCALLDLRPIAHHAVARGVVLALPAVGGVRGGRA